MQSHQDEIDDLYDRMVKVRDRMAKKLGYKNYVELAYMLQCRFDYKQEDVANYRRQVLEDVVPLCNALYERQRERLGYDRLHVYDEKYEFASGNPTPKYDTQEMIARANTMYHELDERCGTFFDFMVEHDLLDLDSKKGKAGGGYCTVFAEDRSPFIFSNFNKTSHDAEVLTHEAGHAFQVFTSMGIRPVECIWPTYESCEIHSMSMEFFTWPWMETFFEEDADKYRFLHLGGAAKFIPYGVLVDHFQHEVYEHPEMTPAERRQTWRRLEKQYLPHKDYTDCEFLENGGWWFRQSHIFMTPFYYIDYALAQICAFQFFERSKKEPEKAWGDYYRLCQAGGSKGYFALLELAGLKNPFVDGTVEEVVAGLKPYLKRKVKYTIRPVKDEDLKKVAEVEALCFPAAEAAGYEDFMERYKTCKNSFFVAETEDGEIAGFCNGCCADTDYLADALYHDATLHNPDGDYQMIFGLDVNPKFQKQGIGEALMRHMVKSAGERDKKAVVLTCKDHMIPFYKRIGYEYIELSDSTHGGAKWHKMMYRF